MSNPIHWRLIDGVYELELCAEPCNEIGTTMLEALGRPVPRNIDGRSRYSSETR